MKKYFKYEGEKEILHFYWEKLISKGKGGDAGLEEEPYIEKKGERKGEKGGKDRDWKVGAQLRTYCSANLKKNKKRSKIRRN